MKIFGLLLMLSLYLLTAFGQAPNVKTIMFGEEAPEVLNGKVKEVIRLATPLNKDFELFYTTVFDTSGNEIFTSSNVKALVFDKTIFTYKYDASGKKTEITGVRADGPGNTIYKFDINERLSEVVDCFNADTDLYKYDQANRVLEIVKTKAGKAIFSIKYKYNANEFQEDFQKGVIFKTGTLTKLIAFDENGNWLKEIKISSDNTGKVIGTDTITRKISCY